MKRFLFFIAVTILLTSSAQGADWNFYGSARIQTFYEKRDYGDLSMPDQNGYSQYLQTNSRIGARIRVNDEISGRFEYGTDASVRILYGEWNFGAGSLLVGQAYTPLNINYSNQAWWDDTNLMDIGGVYNSRAPMLRLKFGGFQIAAIQPDTAAISGLKTAETKIPKVEVKYRLAGSHWDFQIAGGYNGYTLVNGVNEYDIDAYVLAMGGSIKMGQVFLAATLRQGRNTGSYTLQNFAYDSPAIDFTTNTVVDNDSYGYTLVAGYSFSDAVYVEAGYGYSQADLDRDSVAQDEMYSYYIQCRLTLAPGVIVVPEIGVVDWGRSGSGLDLGQTTYYGAKWQIDF